MTSRLSDFLVGLKRRKVTRVGVTYVIVGVGVVEGAPNHRLTAHTFRMDSRFDPIREHPRFRALLDQYAESSLAPESG